ncbi:hypothetical protein D3C78_1471120 [compost metagenome]
MYALSFERLQDCQYVAGTGFVVQQYCDDTTFNGSARHSVKAQRCVFFQSVDVFRWRKMTLLVAERNAQIIGNALRQFDVDMRQLIHDALANIGAHHFA